MPKLKAILALYEAATFVALTGALPDEVVCACRTERDVVLRAFLSPSEQASWRHGPAELKAALRRKSEGRFRAWEAAHADVAALLQRKAERAVFGPVSLREAETA